MEQVLLKCLQSQSETPSFLPFYRGFSCNRLHNGIFSGLAVLIQFRSQCLRQDPVVHIKQALTGVEDSK